MKLTIATAFVSILSLSACSSGSNGSAEQSPATGQAVMGNNPVIGLWKIPPEATEGSINESYTEYFELTEESWIFYFIYDMANCYEAFEFPMTKLEGSTYAVDFSRINDRIGESEVDFIATDNILTYSFVDTEDDDDDGNTTETLVETFSKAENISSMDFNICS